MPNIADIAERLDNAVLQATAVAQLDEPLSLVDAYAVQSASLRRRYARGERRIGIKMGFTQPRENGADGHQRNDLGPPDG